MEQTYFFSGQEVEADDLNDISTKLGDQLKNRTIDFFSQGVISDASETFVFNDANNTIQIQPFIAYTNSGERINVYKTIRSLALKLTDPDERRLTQRGTLSPDEFGWEINVDYDIYVGYIEKVARPRAHKQTGEFYPTRIVSGFEFYAIRPGTDIIANVAGDTPLVRLCHLVYDGTEVHITSAGYLQISTVDAAKIYTKENATKPSIYNPNEYIVSMEEHVMCMGSGTPTPNNPHGLTPADIGVEDKDVSTHEQEMHTPGLLADRSSVNSAFYVLFNSITPPAMDTLIVFNLQGNEKLHHNGVWLSSYKYTASRVFLQFMYGPYNNIVPSGVYTIGIDPSTAGLVFGSDQGASHKIRITSDEQGTETLEEVPVVNMTTYNTSGYYDLAQFTFSREKRESSIISNYATSSNVANFTAKVDLRVFGSLSPNELQTTKENISGVIKDVLTLPYEIHVDAVQLNNGTRLTGANLLPRGYIRGFAMAYSSNHSITVYPGVCRDLNDLNDIVLRSGLTKYIDVQWAQGGYSTPVGGLQNVPGSTSRLTSYGVPLHVFVMMNDAGLVDVACDTDINGSHIREASSPTASFKYIRRIGTLYLSHHATDESSSTRELLRPFSSFTNGNTLYIQYNSSPLLAQDMYNSTSRQFFHTYVPGDFTFKGKFSYEMSSNTITVYVKNPNYVEGSTTEEEYIAYSLQQTKAGAIFLPTAPASSIALHGGGEFEVLMADGTVTTNGDWDFDNHIYCEGYYDSRDIL